MLQQVKVQASQAGNPFDLFSFSNINRHIDIPHLVFSITLHLSSHNYSSCNQASDNLVSYTYILPLLQ